jgi:hypothetical protein
MEFGRTMIMQHDSVNRLPGHFGFWRLKQAKNLLPASLWV